MHEHGDIARAAGLGVLVVLAASSLVLIHDFANSHTITVFGVIIGDVIIGDVIGTESFVGPTPEAPRQGSPRAM